MVVPLRVLRKRAIKTSGLMRRILYRDNHSHQLHHLPQLRKRKGRQKQNHNRRSIYQK